MVDVRGSKDCGNSPKNRFVQDIAIAVEAGAARPEDFAEDIVWQRPYVGSVKGRGAFLREIEGQVEPQLIVIEHAISHGKVGAASGEVVQADGQRRRFSHIMEFTSVKANCVSMLKSYA